MTFNSDFNFIHYNESASSMYEQLPSLTANMGVDQLPGSTEVNRGAGQHANRQAASGAHK
jgi:hypothetical protein